MGHLLPCAIDFKTNHPPIYLQWIGILGMATEPRHVISMGPRQPEVRCDAIVCGFDVFFDLCLNKRFSKQSTHQ